MPIHALKQPFRILLTNSGLNADECLPQVKAAWPGFGINVNTPGELIDLKAAGVVDPVRVEALQNAASIAGTAMTTGALVVDLPEKKAASLPVASIVPDCRRCWPTWRRTVGLTTSSSISLTAWHGTGRTMWRSPGRLTRPVCGWSPPVRILTRRLVGCCCMASCPPLPSSTHATWPPRWSKASVKRPVPAGPSAGPRLATSTGKAATAAAGRPAGSTLTLFAAP